MQTKGKTAAKIIGIILVLLLLAGLVAIIYKFTNGFNEDFKTFYVEYGGEQILTTESEMHLTSGNTHRFDVKYTFDTENTEPKGYNVKIVPNAQRDFDFTDGRRGRIQGIGADYLTHGMADYDYAFGVYLCGDIHHFRPHSYVYGRSMGYLYRRLLDIRTGLFRRQV